MSEVSTDNFIPNIFLQPPLKHSYRGPREALSTEVSVGHFDSCLAWPHGADVQDIPLELAG